MVKRNFLKEQSKLGIRTLDYDVPGNHISRFVVDFIEEVFPILNIKEPKKKKGRDSLPIVSMLKLLVYAKIDHIESARIIADMAKYHEIYKFVSDEVKPSERSIQRYRREYGCYFEVLLKMTLKKASDLKLTDFNHVAVDGTVKKAYNSNNNVITKKETQILLDYFSGLSVDLKKLEKLHKPAKNTDTIYLNQISLSYLADKKIEGLIPNRKQSKEKIGKLNPNPYHKDHFQYDYKLDAFKCPENNYLHFFGKYIEPHKDPEKPDKIKRIYNNYDACKNCKARNKCCSSSQTHRTITEYGSEMQKAMNKKMEKQEFKDEYAKRSSVEGPFGILKEQFNIEKEVVIGMIRTEERLNLDALAYNLIRLYNMTQEIKNSKEDLENFCERESVIHQLKLDVTIF